MGRLCPHKSKIIFISLFILSFYLISCDKLPFKIPFLSPEEPQAPQTQEVPQWKVTGTVIAKVNNMPITLEDLNEEIDNFNSLVPPESPQLKINTREQKIDYLKNEMVRRALLYQDALKRGLEKKEDISRILEKTKADLLVMELVRTEAEGVEVTSKEVEDYYNSYKDQFKEPEERRISEIVVPTEVEAREVLIQLLQGSDFATVAKERSKAASSKNGGDLGFIKKGTNFKEFDDAAFSDTLEIGKTSNIFKGATGYYIVRLEAKRGGNQLSLSDMQDDIKRALTFLKQQQKIEGLINKLSSESKIEINEGAVQ